MNQPVIKEKAAFKIVGITTKTSNANEMTINAQIPALWGTFFEQEVSEKIFAVSDSPITYGLYSDYVSDVNGAYSMTIGREVHSDEAHQEFIVKEIPAAKYAVFTSEKGPIPQVVIETWQNIWTWFAHSNVERTYTGDFEVYDEKSTNPNEAQIEIYIAIK